MRIRVPHFSGHLLDRRDVIHDPEAATVRRDNQIVEVLLHGDPVNRRMRQIVLHRLPIFAVIVRQVNSVFSADVKQTLTHGIFAHAMRITQHRVRNAIRD